MADTDITLGLGIDTSKASQNIQNLAKEVDKIFDGIAKKVSAALNPNILDKDNKRVSLVGVAKAAEKDLDALWAKTHYQTRKAYLAVAKSQGINPERYAQKVVNTINSLETFAPLPVRTQMLAQNIKNHVFDPQTASGKYGALQADIRKYIGLVNSISYLFPGLIPEAGREEAYGLANINLKHGNKARQLDRFLFNKEYNQQATDQIRDYLLATNPKFQAMNDRYKLGLKSTGLPYSDELDPIFLDKYNNMLDIMDSIEEHKAKITAGGMSKAEKNVEIKNLRSDLTKLTTVGRALGKTEEKATKEIKRTNDIFIEKNKGVFGVDGAVWTALAGKVAKDIFGAAGGMLESYWGESITRNAYASRQAYLSRVTTGGKLVGSVLGGLLGALTGNPVAMGVGYATGGEIGQLFGKYSETKYQADIKSSSDMMARLRNKALWGNEYNTYFAKALTDVGIANGESAMGGLADKAMSFRARMMLGQVGEQEMLYMSMVPNFYAALMAGVTGPELLNIYKRDLDAIGDPSMRYLIGQSVGNSEAFAAARNPYFSDMYGTLVGKTELYERAASGMQYGFYRGRITAADDTLDKDIKEIFYSARRGDKTIYQGELENKSWQKFIDAASSLSKLGGLTGTVLNVVVQLDGADIARATQTIDGPDTYVNSLQSFSIGG